MLRKAPKRTKPKYVLGLPIFRQRIVGKKNSYKEKKYNAKFPKKVRISD